MSDDGASVALLAASALHLGFQLTVTFVVYPALAESPGLEDFAGRVSDSGEGRWTVAAAVDEGVPAHVLTAALFERFSSRGEADFGDRLLSAMRKQFGGHEEQHAG